MAAPIRGRGSKFQRLVGSAYADIGETVTISGGGVTSETIDTTNLAPTNGFRTFISGVKDAEEVSIGLNLDPKFTADANKQALLRGDVEGDELVSYRILFSDGSHVTFSAVATAFTIGEQNVTDKVEATFTCKPSGKPVYADS